MITNLFRFHTVDHSIMKHCSAPSTLCYALRLAVLLAVCLKSANGFATHSEIISLSRRLSSSLGQNLMAVKKNQADVPNIVVWDCKKEGDSLVWEPTRTSDPPDNHNDTPLQLSPLVQRTWGWCYHFVLGLQLCPWARASLETKEAIQIFLAPSFLSSEEEYDTLIEDVGRRFESFIKGKDTSLESAAIFFVVFDPKSNGNFYDFGDFYNWFVGMEDEWSLDDVIVAPFHPDWSFAGEPDNLQFEKRSPYPTVSLVSTRVVEAAGPAATEQIGIQNEKVLTGFLAEELEHTWGKSMEKGMPSN